VQPTRQPVLDPAVLKTPNFYESTFPGNLHPAIEMTM
jgi:hypothetical protein